MLILMPHDSHSGNCIHTVLIEQLNKFRNDNSVKYDLFNHEKLSLILEKLDKKEEENRLATERFEALEKKHEELMGVVATLLARERELPDTRKSSSIDEFNSSTPPLVSSPSPPTSPTQHHQPPPTEPEQEEQEVELVLNPRPVARVQKKKSANQNALTNFFSLRTPSSTPKGRTLNVSNEPRKRQKKAMITPQKNALGSLVLGSKAAAARPGMSSKFIGDSVREFVATAVKYRLTVDRHGMNNPLRLASGDTSQQKTTTRRV